MHARQGETDGTTTAVATHARRRILEQWRGRCAANPDAGILIDPRMKLDLYDHITR